MLGAAYIVFGIITILYIVMIVLFTISWYIRKDEDPSSDKHPLVSVIIASRNEAQNLPLLLNSLLAQNYNGDFEILIVNDHSEDDSISIIESQSDSRIILLNLPDSIKGKKEALRYGAKHAKGELLLFTDADCTLPENWILAMANGINEKNLKMLCGPVEFISYKNLFSYLVELEFLSLTGSGAAGMFLKTPFMCNGANYAIKKDVFDEASGHFNDKYSSGDDVFLLHYVSQNYRVDFLKSKDAIVKTKAPENLSGFFSQRIRWASKTSGYRTFASIYTVLVTFLMSFGIVAAFVGSIFEIEFLAIATLILVTKIIFDLMFMLPVLSFHNKLKLVFLSPLLQVFYPLYIFATGLLSLLSKPSWKGRKIR